MKKQLGLVVLGCALLLAGALFLGGAADYLFPRAQWVLMQRSSTPAGGLVITAHASFSNEAACWAAAKQTADAAAAREGTTAVRQGTRWQWHAVSPGEPVVLGQTWCGTVE